MESKIIPWPEIEKFSSMLSDLKDDSDAQEALKQHSGKITYRGKIKLHGTNSGVFYTEGGTVLPQSRTRVLIGCDNEGFSKWVLSLDFFGKWMKQLKDHLKAKQMVLFGEWCGQGIMRGAAICSVPGRHYCIFALKLDDDYIVEPNLLEDLLLRFSWLSDSESKEAQNSVPKNFLVLPWQTEEYSMIISGDGSETLEKKVEEMNLLIQAVDNEDPWVKKTFGVSGPGEGIVWYPVSFTRTQEFFRIKSSWYDRTVFKAKGEKHLVVKQAKPIQTKLEVPQGAKEFVDMFVTEGRLEQGITAACGGEIHRKHIAAFINWVVADVKKESGPELEAAEKEKGVTWTQLEPMIKTKAREWMLAKCNAIGKK